MTKVAKAATWLVLVVAAVAALAYAWDVDRRSKADECVKSTSPDGRYVAERCLVQWRGPDDCDYVGRVYDAKSGQLLVERSFSTPVPELSWWKNTVSFSRGGDEASSVYLPPSLYDRVKALLP
ncbi:hypothetical protein KY49_3279 [Burkholderia sp. MSHR3999]|nr:hypothetical protein KY49_3279 [Burkholderia sp. MSHR3999]